MALSLFFSDGFDTYTAILDKWTNVGADNAISSDGSKSRSGLGCLIINSGGGGPTQSFGSQTNVLVTTAFNPLNNTTNGNFAGIIQIGDQNNKQLTLGYNQDLSISVQRDGSDPFTHSAAGVLQLNTYNYIAFRVLFSHTATGSIRIWVNGVQVLDLPNVITGPSVGSTGFVSCQLLKFGGLIASYHDDVTMWTWTDAVNDNFAYAPSVLPWVANADSTPLNWTPKTGTQHFAMVDAVPASTSNYVFDSTVGDEDQYLHQIPANQLKPALGNNAQVLAINHNMLAQLDAAGSRSLASLKNGVQGPLTFSLTTGALIYQQPYTPGITSVGDMNTTPFGPKVTA